MQVGSLTNIDWELVAAKLIEVGIAYRDAISAACPWSQHDLDDRLDEIIGENKVSWCSVALKVPVQAADI